MQFISTRGKAPPVTFSEAALHGLAPDGGLYVPASWPQLPDGFLKHLSEKSLHEICFEISKLFIDELDEIALRRVIESAINFDTPLIHLSENRYVLELFHGPTLAFKDVGARFMAQIFREISQQKAEDIIILVATSGDTGSAVAQGFAGIKGVQVCLLYPGGKISRIQEQQLTTVGKNVTALEIDGTFDDCQHMVKQAFSDEELNRNITLSSANSINIARLLPQAFYYLYAVSQLFRQISQAKKPIFCVPSGNFGNLTAGLIAQKIGMPACGFIAATNVNDIVPEYLETGQFNPRSSIQTISNAMDVGNPSNFERMLYLAENSHQKMRELVWGASFTDDETRRSVQQVHNELNYLMDPHTAIAWLAAKQYEEQHQGYFGEKDSTPFILLSTAHPAKFGDIIEPIIGKEVKIPKRLQKSLEKQKESIKMSNCFGDLKGWMYEFYV
jgi:threonine synthase